jgi:type II secretory pathway pseudopilin PulG
MATARALTLIEVVAGLALLVAIMAALLLAKSHWQRRLADSGRRLAANSAADELLSAWLQNPKAFPIQSGGAVPEHADMRWETSLVSNTGVERLGTRVVRLEILPTDHAAAPLCRVELVLPNPDDFHD